MGEGGAVNIICNFLSKIVESFRDWGRDCWCPSGVDNTCKSGLDGHWATCHQVMTINIPIVILVIILSLWISKPQLVAFNSSDYQTLLIADVRTGFIYAKNSTPYQNILNFHCLAMLLDGTHSLFFMGRFWLPI